MISSIDNQEFNSAYMAQASASAAAPVTFMGLSASSDDMDPSPHSIEVEAPIAHALEAVKNVGVVGRQKSMGGRPVREMMMNSPRLMNNILSHLSHLHPETGTPGLHMESFDADSARGAGTSTSTSAAAAAHIQSAPYGAPHSIAGSMGIASIPNTLKASFGMKNSMTNQSHIHDSLASAMNISNAFGTILSEAWDHIDIIIMDFVMVNMNGPEAVQHIRSMGYKGLIIGLTAKALSNDINIFLIHGVDAVFSKPLNWNLFMETYEILNEMNNKYPDGCASPDLQEA